MPRLTHTSSDGHSLTKSTKLEHTHCVEVVFEDEWHPSYFVTGAKAAERAVEKASKRCAGRVAYRAVPISG